MNIFELLIIVLVCISGFFSGMFLSSYFSIIGWIIGVPAGSLLAVLILKTLRLLIDPWNMSKPVLPKCKNGKCQSICDYELVEITNDGNVFSCKCGDKYLFTGKQFMIILDNGDTSPYMVKRKIRGPWEEDVPTTGDQGNLD